MSLSWCFDRRLQQTYKPALPKIKPGDLVGLRLPDPAVCLVVTTSGENGDLNHRNGPWYIAVEHLCTDVITKFPHRSDCAMLQQVKKRPDETVAYFLYHMEEVFCRQSGMERPADFTVLGPWEKMLCGYLMEGRLPEIAAQTKTLYVRCRHGVRFEELKRHALHSDNGINDRKKKKADKRETDLHNAALTLYYSTNQHGSFSRARGRGRQGRCRGRGLWSRSNTCHNCEQLGHWKNECPEKLKRPDSGN
ncbi:hypothetical protein XENOCAPTIV_008204 [Xenoophorus captivus]|uniref:CCHC-type domain-containing protein n=1 Tax=Xenoophorus captivus TaxID=1517983 RepID=A0ABV0S5T8_9TELE